MRRLGVLCWCGEGGAFAGATSCFFVAGVERGQTWGRQGGARVPMRLVGDRRLNADAREADDENCFLLASGFIEHGLLQAGL